MPAWVAGVIITVLLLAAAVILLVTGGNDPPPTAAAPQSGIVWAVGDADASEYAKGVASRIAADGPQRVLYLGDVYEKGSAADFRDRFKSVWGKLGSRMEPTPGNHDWPEHTVGYDPYWRAVLHHGIAHSYAFTVAGWRFLSLNSETPNDPAQLAFVRRELARSGGTCVIPYWHRPRLNAGMHRDEQVLVDRLWRAVEGKVPLVLSGHDHDLQRFRPVHGTVQYIAGAGGRGHYHVDAKDPRLAFSDDRHFGALRIQLQPKAAELTAVAADGTVLDRSTVRCRAASP